jgi:hypothetical protein
MKATKKAVDTAITVAVKSFHTETLEQVTRVEALATDVESGRKEIMVTLHAHYGNAIAPAKQGGLSGNAMRTDDSIKAEASRLDITEGAARELHGIIKAINEVRANVWQDYQRAFFGRNEKAATVRDEPENIKALKAEKKERETQVQLHKAKAAMAKAAMLTAESDGAYEEAKSRMEEANKDAKDWAAMAKVSAENIKVAAEDNAGADAYGALHEAARKLGEQFKDHKDAKTSELAIAILALL